MKKILNVGIIGTGFGVLAHLPAYNQNKKCKVIAIFGRESTETTIF